MHSCKNRLPRGGGNNPSIRILGVNPEGMLTLGTDQSINDIGDKKLYTILNKLLMHIDHSLYTDEHDSVFQ